MAIRACLSMQKSSFIIPKLTASDSSIFNEDPVYTIPQGYFSYDYQHFLCVFHNQNVEVLANNTGTRGRVILGNIKMENILLNIKTQKEFESLIEIQRGVLKSFLPSQ